MNFDRDIDQILGDLQQRMGADQATATDFTHYLGRPVEFAREVCQATLLGWQAEALAAFVARDLLSIATCNGAGKTGGFSPLAMLYALFVEGGLVVYMTSTAAQARAQILRELKRWISRSTQLACDIFQHGITLATGATLLLVSPGQMESAAGHHDERLTIIVDEASALDDDLFEAMMGNVIASGNRLILLGNPLRMEGCFAATHRPGNDWWKRAVTAEEIIADPNAALIRGLIDKAGVNKLRQTFGEESAAFQSRVWARFPGSPTDALYSEVLLQAAVERWRQRTLIQRASSYHVGIDWAASEEGDETIVALVRNGHVLSLHPTRERDTMVQVRWIGDLAARHGIAQRVRPLSAAPDWLPPGNPDRYNGFPALFIVDEVGVGKGASDRLSELGYEVELFNAARRPPKEEDRLLYANERARIAAKFRDRLVEGSVAIPDDEMLLQELRVYSAFTNQSGKLQCVAKDDLRRLLGRSPDRLDAVLMACTGPTEIDFSSVSLGGPVAF